jgi:hypothetical protein
MDVGREGRTSAIPPGWRKAFLTVMIMAPLHRRRTAMFQRLLNLNRSIPGSLRIAACYPPGSMKLKLISIERNALQFRARTRELLDTDTRSHLR